MRAECRVFADMIDSHQLARIPDFIADSGLHHQLTARLQAEANFIEHTAGHPAVFGDSRHRSEAHAGEFADQIEDAGDRVDLSDIAHVRFEVSRQAHRGIILFESWSGGQYSRHHAARGKRRRSRQARTKDTAMPNRANAANSPKYRCNPGNPG